jgi:hypothetical protein
MHAVTETVIDGLSVSSVVRAAATGLEREFPGSLVWFGAETGHWWAVVAVVGGWRLVEATDPYDLAAAMRGGMALPWSGRRTSREVGVRW